MAFEEKSKNNYNNFKYFCDDKEYKKRIEYFKKEYPIIKISSINTNFNEEKGYCTVTKKFVKVEFVIQTGIHYFNCNNLEEVITNCLEEDLKKKIQNEATFYHYSLDALNLLDESSKLA